MRRGWIVEELPSSSWVISLAKVGKSSLDKTSTFVVNRWTKGMQQRLVMRSQLRVNSIFIVESSEEKGQPGTQLIVYFFMFVKIYSSNAFIFYTHTFSLPWLDLENIWPLPLLFLFFHIGYWEEQYGTCKLNRWIWVMKKEFWNADTSCCKPQDDTTGFRATINAEEKITVNTWGYLGIYKQRAYKYSETTHRKSHNNNGPQTGVDPNFVVADIYIIWWGHLWKLGTKMNTEMKRKITMTTLTLETAILFLVVEFL